MRLSLLLIFTVLVGCAGKRHVYKHIITTDPLKLCFVGDTGTGLPIQKKVAKYLSHERCHSIHFLGDMIYRNGIHTSRDKEFYSKFYDNYYQLSDQNQRPDLYVILGNHDHRGSVKAWMELSEKHPNIIFPNPWYMVKINELCLVHLDTDYYKLFFKLAGGYAQKSWLRRLNEEELEACKVKLALTHHPYESRGKDHGSSSGLVRNFFEDNIIGKFDYLISGHEHILSDEGVKKGTRLLISGAGGNPDKDEDGGYLVMTWNEKTKKLSYQFKKISPE